ncbi:MAG: hypothetical protein ABIA93_03020 [Candidatus Woesearchaeota archaeon]
MADEANQTQNFEIKAKLRLDINRSLLAICFALFGIIIAIQPELLGQTPWLPIQLTLAIPLLFTSIFARSKLATARLPKMWEEYGFITFLIGYALLINVTGILLSTKLSVHLGLIFLFSNIFISLVYSTLEVIETKSKLKTRLYKDSFFALLILIGGILPSLGIF